MQKFQKKVLEKVQEIVKEPQIQIAVKTRKGQARAGARTIEPFCVASLSGAGFVRNLYEDKSSFNVYMHVF